MQQQLCSGAAELVGAPGAVLVELLADGRSLVVASAGTGPPVGAALPLGAEALRVAGRDDAPGVVQLPGARGATPLAVLACRSAQGEQALGLVLPEGRELDAEEADVLRLLVAQAAAALTNAATHAVVVGQRAHEQAVVDVLADGVVVLDDAGRMLACNEVGAALLGAPRDALLGTVPALALGAEGVAAHGQTAGRWVETVVTRLGSTGERVVTLRDISRQRALDEAKDLFLATTSHELRTPLTAVKGYLHVLQHRWDVLDDARRLEALRTVSERTDALIALTDHLLLGARASASRHSAARVPFELSSAVASAAGSFAEVSSRHDLRIVDDGPVQVLGDPSSVTHIVGQLVENAVKYSPGGGTVEVRVRRDAQFAIVEVADEGIGLPADEMALFAPFFQAGATNTREYGGVGLGLYIVRQLVEAQGGHVLACNREPAGAVVGFSVPLAGEPPVPRTSADDDGASGATPPPDHDGARTSNAVSAESEPG